MATLPYERTTAGEKALGEITKLLMRFGCDRIGNMTNNAEGTVLVQFHYRGRDCTVKASMKGYAAKWLQEHPKPKRGQSMAQHQQEALRVASVAVYSILRDWIKGQLTAIETGIVPFDSAFLGAIMLPGTVQTVMEHIEQKKMLPALPKPPKDT